MKTSLKTHVNAADWTSHLPLVLLGIRSSLKEDLGGSSAQLILGSSVRLPGQYFEFRKYQFESHFEYFQRLNKYIHSLRAIPPRLVTSNASFIDQQLHNADYVFVRKEASRSPLERTYFGPFKVIYKANKYITLLQNGVLNNVSINRLKTHTYLFFTQMNPCNLQHARLQKMFGYLLATHLLHKHLNFRTWIPFSDAVEWGMSSDLLLFLIYSLY